jgi:hypothetical protein
MLASSVGGYLAGRLRASWGGLHNDEIYFRDTAHGLLAWAFALLLGAIALGAASTHIVAGASAGLAPAVAATATSQGQPTDVYVDTLLQTEPRAGGADAQATGSDSRGAIGRMLTPVLRKGGDVSAADRAYLAKVVAARTGLNQADAEKRVSDVIVQAKKAADDARRTAAQLMLWIAASMLAGAVASILGATEGGLLRDSKWYEPGWRNSLVRNH